MIRLDVAAALRSLEAAGVALIDKAPRAGAHGTTVAFVHPRGARGVLLELVQLLLIVRAFLQKKFHFLIVL